MESASPSGDVPAVREFHKNEHLAFDATLDREVLRHFLADESLGQASLIQKDDEAIGYILLTSFTSDPSIADKALALKRWHLQRMPVEG
jgi:hypothetical protein